VNSSSGVTIIAATPLEARAVRRFAPENVRVVECGIALCKARDFDGLTISCGLAGGLGTAVATGTVLVPMRVRRPDGTEFACDPRAVDALANAARELGCPVVCDPLVTTAELVHGMERAHWAAQGYAGVDMETGLLTAPRVACVRVVLDTPEREISPAWTHPARAILHPGAWRDLPFLLRQGPRCAAIAARIAARAATFL
jgi:hypothetical protein